MSNSFTLSSIESLRSKIKLYLDELKILYPEHTITPKQHFLVHYPSSIVKFGPPKDYWVMRFEAKHLYFKTVNRVTYNHINLLKSLATRHQNLQVYHLSSLDYFFDVEFGSLQSMNENQREFIEIGISSSDFEVYNWIEKDGIRYKINDIIVKKENNLSVLASIQAIIYANDNIIFLINNLKILRYIDYMASYEVEQIETMNQFLRYDQLSSPWPHDLYTLSYNKNIVSPKYPI